MIATIGRLVSVLEGIEARVKHESDEKMRKHLKEKTKKVAGEAGGGRWHDNGDKKT